MKNEIMQLIEQSHLRTERYSIPCIQSRLEPEDVRSQIFIAAAQFSPDAFQAFVRQNEATLKEVLSAKEVNLLKAIAADLRRSNRSLNAIKIPGQSNKIGRSSCTER